MLLSFKTNPHLLQLSRDAPEMPASFKVDVGKRSTSRPLMKSMLLRSCCAQSLSFAGELLSTPDLWHQVHISSEREGTKKLFKHIFWYHNSRQSVTSCIFPSWLIFNHTSVDSPTQTRCRSDGLRRTALQSYLLTGQFRRKFPRSFQEFGMKVYPPRHLCEETGHLLGSI